MILRPATSVGILWLLSRALVPSLLFYFRHQQLLPSVTMPAMHPTGPYSTSSSFCGHHHQKFLLEEPCLTILTFTWGCVLFHKIIPDNLLQRSSRLNLFSMFLSIFVVTTGTTGLMKSLESIISLVTFDMYDPDEGISSIFAQKQFWNSEVPC